MDYRHQFQQYLEEVEAYLAKVRKGRRVPSANPQAPQYSQAADDQRLIERGVAPAGYGSSMPPSSPETFDPRGIGQAFTAPGGQSPSYGFKHKDKRGEDGPAKSLAERLARDASEVPPAKIQSQIQDTNAHYDQLRAPAGTLRFTPIPLNVYGYTQTGGDYKGRSVVSYGGDKASQDVPNTVSHELFHRRRTEPDMDQIHSNIGNSKRWQLMDRMNEVQPSSQDGPYFGKNHSWNAEEQLANIAGYEGSLPRGTAIGDTDVGRILFEKRPELKNYYYHYLSQPYGGLWNDQGGWTGRNVGDQRPKPSSSTK